MKGNAWLLFLATATAEFGVIGVMVWAIWFSLTPDERVFVSGLWITYAGMPILASLFLLVLLGLGINLLFRWYINPLREISDEIRVIAMSNPKRRLVPEGRPGLKDLMKSINLLAERYQSLREDVQVQIQTAKKALEEEKNTLAALMSKLTQGVLVCNREGKILLYNQRAQNLLEVSTPDSDAPDWLGLGRSVYGLLAGQLISHALTHIDHRLAQGEGNVMVPFVASRRGGQMLSVHLVPVLGQDSFLTGYILTLEDISHHIATENRRETLLQTLTEGQRSSIAGIRAAIEAILSYPEMDETHSRQFQAIIQDESVKLSQQLERILTEYSEELKAQWILKEMLVGDLLAAVQRRLEETYGVTIEMSAPLKPLWLRVDSYAFVQGMTFVVGKLLKERNAEDIELRLEAQPPPLASLEILWKGAFLDMKTLAAWGKEPLLSDRQDSLLTLHDAIDRHGGAVWTQTHDDGRYSINLLLTVASARERTDFAAATPGQDYDFSLFSSANQQSGWDEFSLSDIIYTVIDTETTGLNPSDGDEIIAIGAVRVVNGRLLEREVFGCFVNPRRPISEASMKIHGIAPEILKDKPVIEEVLPKFHRFVEDSVIVGHNVAFDMRFLALKEKRTGVKFTNPILDTLLLATVVHPDHEQQSLEAIAERLGIPVTGRHSATGDAMTTAKILVALVPLLAERDIHTLKQARLACEATEYARIRY